MSETPTPPIEPSELHSADLLLAAGCVRRDPEALATFEERYLTPLRSCVNDIDSNPARLDELKQLVRERLLVAEGPGSPPRIGSYTGRGALGAWVQIVARRLALSSLRKGKLDELTDDALEDQLCVGTDPELDYMRLRYAQEFRQALEASLQELSSHERLLLRLHLVDGASLTSIAGAYQVSQSTISRRLQQARDTVGARMKERLEALHGMTASEFQSLLHLVESRFELSLERALRSEAQLAVRSATPPDVEQADSNSAKKTF
ncbi:MAG TPA: sigma-70 family RNA polymerase sigma factor [Polyangiaceae bacterium]|nr:sigma-70 family RNA polymerase sigma factor [Polyangiaceae bacterium]